MHADKIKEIGNKMSNKKQLFVVGMGPGSADLVAPKALKAVQESTDLVAYGLVFRFVR